MHDQIQEESGTNLGISRRLTPENQKQLDDCTMGNKVWVKLVIIDNNKDDGGQAAGIEIKSEMDVDDLKKAVAKGVSA
jgi:hypothetical protein